MKDINDMPIEQVRQGYAIITGLENGGDFTDAEIRDYMSGTLSADEVEDLLGSSSCEMRLNLLKEVFGNLMDTSGRNEKIRLLGSAKDRFIELGIGFVLEDTLKFLFDPMVVTGISKAKLQKDVEPSDQIESNLIELIYYLRKHNTGRDVDLSVVRGFLNANPKHADWVGQLVTKSLKLGIDVPTINKVFGKDFIKVFSVMLADSWADNPNYLDGKQFVITQKLDGLRCVAFVYDNNEVKFFTRNGQDYGDVPDVAEELLKLPARNVAYDGELIAKSASKDSGEVFRETSSVARTDGTKRGLVYHVFDRLPLNDFLNGFSPINCVERKLNLSCDFSKNTSLDWVEYVSMLYFGDDQSKISEWMEVAELYGWEGLMLNVCDAPYRSKRVRDLLKVKKFKTVDVRVTGVYEGEGSFVGTLGGINCEFDVDGEVHTTNCGSGFTLEQRRKYWKTLSKVDFEFKPVLDDKGFPIRLLPGEDPEDSDKLVRFGEEGYSDDLEVYEKPVYSKSGELPNPDFVDLIGKIVELKCFEISTNRDGTRSLRFPIWLDIIRFDKDTTSIV